MAKSKIPLAVGAGVVGSLVTKLLSEDSGDTPENDDAVFEPIDFELQPSEPDALETGFLTEEQSDDLLAGPSGLSVEEEYERVEVEAPEPRPWGLGEVLGHNDRTVADLHREGGSPEYDQSPSELESLFDDEFESEVNAEQPDRRPAGDWDGSQSYEAARQILNEGRLPEDRIPPEPADPPTRLLDAAAEVVRGAPLGEALRNAFDYTQEGWLDPNTRSEHGGNEPAEMEAGFDPPGVENDHFGKELMDHLAETQDDHADNSDGGGDREVAAESAAGGGDPNLGIGGGEGMEAGSSSEGGETGSDEGGSDEAGESGSDSEGGGSGVSGGESEGGAGDAGPDRDYEGGTGRSES